MAKWNEAKWWAIQLNAYHVIWNFCAFNKNAIYNVKTCNERIARHERPKNSPRQIVHAHFIAYFIGPFYSFGYVSFFFWFSCLPPALYRVSVCVRVFKWATQSHVRVKTSTTTTTQPKITIQRKLNKTKTCPKMKLNRKNRTATQRKIITENSNKFQSCKIKT